jgi:hypothetical protein
VTSKTLILGIEVQKFSKTKTSRNFKRLVSLSELALVISRLLGRSMGKPGVTKDFWSSRLTDRSATFKLIRLVRGNSCLVMEIDVSQLARSEVLALARSQARLVQEYLRGLNLTVAKEFLIHPVVGIVQNSVDKGDTYPSEWLVLNGNTDRLDFKIELASQLVMRTTIERALINWALRPSKRFNRIVDFFKLPYSASKIRRWDVEPMADQLDLVEKYANLRTNFNLNSVRKEILENARSWWTTATLIAALIGLLCTPLIDYFWNKFIFN